MLVNIKLNTAKTSDYIYKLNENYISRYCLRKKSIYDVVVFLLILKKKYFLIGQNNGVFSSETLQFCKVENFDG